MATITNTLQSNTLQALLGNVYITCFTVGDLYKLRKFKNFHQLNTFWCWCDNKETDQVENNDLFCRTMNDAPFISCDKNIFMFLGEQEHVCKYNDKNTIKEILGGNKLNQASLGRLYYKFLWNDKIITLEKTITQTPIQQQSSNKIQYEQQTPVQPWYQVVYDGTNQGWGAYKYDGRLEEKSMHDYTSCNIESLFERINNDK